MESLMSFLPSPRLKRSSSKPRVTRSTSQSPYASFPSLNDEPDNQGLANFSKLAAELAYGKDSKPIVENRLAITQSISGTGALRIGTAFLARFYPGAKALYLPTPTWGNHIPIAKDSGLEVKQYSYFDKKTVGLDFEGMKRDIKVSTWVPCW
jgi:aspartate aminotransferase